MKGLNECIKVLNYGNFSYRFAANLFISSIFSILFSLTFKYAKFSN